MQEYSSTEIVKRKISDSPISLMHKADFHTISITDITREARVSRATFYRYFDKKETVIHYYFDKLIERFGLTSFVKPKTYDEYRAYATKVLSVIQKNRGVIRLVIKADNGAIILKYLDEQYTKSQGGEDGYNIDTLMPYLYSGAVYNMLLKWVAEDCRTPIETLTDILVKMIPKTTYSWENVENENKGLQK